ncbi:uncharacterized protein [Typha angustifolia]|uniref:uncharacterized protein n=1 Tax=Typha angustifolia TaxID=59011 RepID=UPI003C2C3D6D
MGVVFVNHVIPSIYCNFPARWFSMSKVYRHVPSIGRTVKKSNRSRVIPSSKNSSFQDFQVFLEPSRLLLASEPNTYARYVPEETVSSLKLDMADSFYMIELCTSRDFGSCLRDINAAILLCLIDVNGDSLLQRIPAISLGCRGQEKETDFLETVHFQRGAVDFVTFKGSKLGKIEALWVGLESGSWKLDGVQLTVIDGPSTMSGSVEEVKEALFDCMQYKFEPNNVLLGEGGISVAELSPVLAIELPANSVSSLSDMQDSSSTLLLSKKVSKEDGMREYADLKLSLLLYDLLLISTGSTALILSSSEKAAYSFLIGGFGGFLYLLLLQRSVDGLSVEKLPSEDGEMENNAQAYGGLERPWLVLALVLAASVVAVKYGLGGATVSLTPTELFIGVAGFLSSKIAVVLAAFKPIKRSPKTTN